MRKDWEYKKLGEVGTIITGSTPSTKDNSNYLPQEYCFVKPSDLIEQGICKITKTEFYLSKKGFSISRALPIGSVLVSCIGSIGKIGVLTKEACSNQQINAIIPSNNIDSFYLAYVLCGIKYKLEEIANAPVVPIINKTAFSKVIIPIPPKPTQLAIVAELDKINELIQLKKEQLKDYDQLAQSIFYEMFGDPVENEKGWEVKNIESVCSSIVRGPFGSALKKDFFVPKNNSTYKIYEQKNAIQKNASIGSYYITEERFKELSRFELLPGDIIMSCSGTIGELYRIPVNAEKGIMNQALLKFSLLKQINFLYFLYLMDYVKKEFTIRGSGLQNIGSVKIIKSMKFGLPPLPLQQQFAARIEAIERQKQQVSETIKDLETLLASRMQYWFD